MVDSRGKAQIHPVAHWVLLVQLPRQAAKPVAFVLSWSAETVPAPSTPVTSKASKPFLVNFNIGATSLRVRILYGRRKQRRPCFRKGAV